MSSQEQAIKEAKELIDLYGLEALARALPLTDRAVQYWFAEEKPKKPGRKTQVRVHELFRLHKSGEGLGGPQEPQQGHKSGVAHNGQKENYMAGESFNNFSIAHKTVIETNATLANVIAHVLPGNLLDQVLAPKIAELLREQSSGKKQMSTDELLKRLRKALTQDNGYK